eukprot:CAMPEP_0177788138 /NCGR_PEP_ID=MMETSP0491_2-20121128/21926_1 /TAXON_ID=63592 /ORGANISM="Tetraselmis chuii, Strain PLY429" /LENGTH=77 /DNA_ID=CAMNT_0019309655 /DNA_START=291 /DNA_END=524 /DNA_ORIENTATION=-
MPTAKGFNPTPLKTAKLVLRPTAAIAVANSCGEAVPPIPDINPPQSSSLINPKPRVKGGKSVVRGVLATFGPDEACM